MYLSLASIGGDGSVGAHLPPLGGNGSVVVIVVVVVLSPYSLPEACPKPSDQPRDAARGEECSDLDEKSLTTFCR